MVGAILCVLPRQKTKNRRDKINEPGSRLLFFSLEMEEPTMRPRRYTPLLMASLVMILLTIASTGKPYQSTHFLFIGQRKGVKHVERIFGVWPYEVEVAKTRCCFRHSLTSSCAISRRNCPLSTAKIDCFERLLQKGGDKLNGSRLFFLLNGSDYVV